MKSKESIQAGPDLGIAKKRPQSRQGLRLIVMILHDLTVVVSLRKQASLVLGLPVVGI